MAFHKDQKIYVISPPSFYSDLKILPGIVLKISARTLAVNVLVEHENGDLIHAEYNKHGASSRSFIVSRDLINLTKETDK